MKLVYVKDCGVFGIISNQINDGLVLTKWYIDGFLHLKYLAKEDYVSYGDLLDE